ncbi:ERV1B [Auxenochlorella protothecoides x Auxenochlorella symbiontica]
MDPPPYNGCPVSGSTGSQSAARRQESGAGGHCHSLWVVMYSGKTRHQQICQAVLQIDILTRMYPCGECAAHFKELVRNNPPRVASGPELQQYMCELHNQVNQRLRKPAFNCALAGARWRALDCDEDGVAACAIQPANSSLGARRWPW